MCVLCDMEWPRVYKTTHNALYVVSTHLPDIKYSPHRSKRLWKKLRKKGSRPRYSHIILVSSKNTADKIVENLLVRKPLKFKTSGERHEQEKRI